MFSTARQKQVSVTAQTTRSQLSSMKQCDHSLIVTTFFSTKNFN